MTGAYLVAGLLLLTAACAGSGTSDDDPGPQPPERLAAAVTFLADANTGRFASETAGAAGVLRSRIEGGYRLSPPAAGLTVTRYDAEGKPHRTEVVAIGRDAWSRAPGARCWTRHDVDELVDYGLLVRNGDTYAPAPVAVVGLGRGVYATHAEQISGTSELATVLAVADLSLPSALGLGRADDHRVPTTFTLDNDALVGWKVFVRDAVEQIRKHAGPDAVGKGRVSAFGALGGTITTRLTRLGDGFDAAPPLAACPDGPP